MRNLHSIHRIEYLWRLFYGNGAPCQNDRHRVPGSPQDEDYMRRHGDHQYCLFEQAGFDPGDRTMSLWYCECGECAPYQNMHNIAHVYLWPRLEEQPIVEFPDWGRRTRTQYVCHACRDGHHINDAMGFKRHEHRWNTRGNCEEDCGSYSREHDYRGHQNGPDDHDFDNYFCRICGDMDQEHPHDYNPRWGDCRICGNMDPEWREPRDEEAF